MELLKKDKRIWDGSHFNKTYLYQLLENYDKELMELLISDKEIKNTYFEKIGDIYIFKYEDFRSLLDMNDLDGSFTSFSKQIGLSNKGKYLSEATDYVLDWPYKDCILEGGMSSEEHNENYIYPDHIEKSSTFDKSSGSIIFESESYNFRIGQKRRQEIFYNNIIAKKEIDKLLDKKAFKNFIKYTADGETKVENFDINSEGFIKDNLIIKGNNLLAMESLKEQFSGKVKCIYIDPPYNTGSDSFAYNDRFNHSTWLTFMKNRLSVAREFLSDQGVIYVQCDNNEQGYLKVLMDEIFNQQDQDNYITSISVKSKTPSGVGQESYIFDVLETIHVYAKNRSFLPSNNYKLPEEILDENSKSAVNYRYLITNFGEDDSETAWTSPGGIPGKIVKLKNFEYKSIPKKEATKEWFYKNYENIFRMSPANGGMMKKLTPNLPEGPCYFEYVPTKGKNANKLTKVYFIKKQNVVFIKDQSYLDEEYKQIVKTVNVHNNWTNESLWQGIANEGDVKLKNGKKPEKLIKRILEISTNEGDLVLDYHLGSGTTAAVAHKMNRQYIGIEQMEYGDNGAEKRLNNVISGDTTGISKEIKWKGGGEFIYFELAQYNEEAKLKIEKCKSFNELKKLFNELVDHYFLDYNVSIKSFKKILNNKKFTEIELDVQKGIFKSLLDNNQLYIAHEEQDDPRFNLDKHDISLSNLFYGKN
tara:strand:- start:3517 stop:5619 length:2103 start_codon:yes stop_codon:yes gene_type:complete